MMNHDCEKKVNSVVYKLQPKKQNAGYQLKNLKAVISLDRKRKMEAESENKKAQPELEPTP